jgi:hypothetical protein
MTNTSQSILLIAEKDLAKVEVKLITAIEASKDEIIKWMFSGFAMLMLAIIGLYFKH